MEYSLGVNKVDNPILITSPEDVYKLLKPYHDCDREVMFTLHLMPDMRVHYVQRSAIGSSAAICFDTHDIFREAIILKSKAIIVAHNHPYEENVSPSTEDKNVTKRLYNIGEEARISLIDHIVFGPQKFFSIAQNMSGIFPSRPYYTLTQTALEASRVEVVTEDTKTSKKSSKKRDQIVKRNSSPASSLILKCWD